MSYRFSRVGMVGWGILLVHGLGCGPEVKTEGYGPFEIPIERERIRLDERHTALNVRVPPEQLVREMVDEESGLTYEAWVDKQIDESSGQVLFSRWHTHRLAPHKYEVRFTFNQVFQDNRIVPSGYAWNVDLRMGWVHPPRVLNLEDLDPSARSRLNAKSEETPPAP